MFRAEAWNGLLVMSALAGNLGDLTVLVRHRSLAKWLMSPFQVIQPDRAEFGCIYRAEFCEFFPPKKHNHA